MRWQCPTTWVRDEPEELAAVRLGARLDRRPGDATAALPHADQILGEQPTDSAMRDVRKNALAGLRKQLE